MTKTGTDDEGPPNFDHLHKIMSLFCDNAKTYIQLSGAALALTLTFAHEILHIPASQNIADGWMVAMWLCFLVAIIMGAFYQYIAVKLLEVAADSQAYNPWKWLEPGQIYGVMLGAFYGGTGIFTVYAILRLRHHQL